MVRREQSARPQQALYQSKTGEWEPTRLRFVAPASCRLSRGRLALATSNSYFLLGAVFSDSLSDSFLGEILSSVATSGFASGTPGPGTLITFLASTCFPYSSLFASSSMCKLAPFSEIPATSPRTLDYL